MFDVTSQNFDHESATMMSKEIEPVISRKIKTPVVFLIFNRPEGTRRVFDAIRAARPPRLLVVADGPRSGHPTDPERCAAVRRLVEKGVDWKCELSTHYAEENLGCGRRVSSGLDWAFSHEEKLIVLEDDCLPDPSFFSFCEELLDRYENEPRVGQICGCLNFVSQLDRKSSYVFSHYDAIWGWASWRRAWRFYDFNIEDWPEVRRSGRLRKVCQSWIEYRRRTELYDRVYERAFNVWGYQWTYAKLANGLLSVMPEKNLIENIGMGPDATHAKVGQFELQRLSMEFPLIHPEKVESDAEFDRFFGARFRGTSFRWRLKRWLRRAVGNNK